MIYKGLKITKISAISNNYNAKYIITINNDIVDFANSIKESKEAINRYLYALDVSEGKEV